MVKKIPLIFLGLCSIGVGVIVAPNTVFAIKYLGGSVPKVAMELFLTVAWVSIICGVIMIRLTIIRKPYSGEILGNAHYKYIMEKQATYILSAPGLFTFAHSFWMFMMFGPDRLKAYAAHGFYAFGTAAILLTVMGAMLIFITYRMSKKVDF